MAAGRQRFHFIPAAKFSLELTFLERMECTVQKQSNGEDAKLLELEKLQQLVQQLQQQNEQLMAAASPRVMQNGENRQRREQLAAAAVDPPRDSGIDLSASCSDDLEDDILDLDRFDLQDDDESWLYSTPATKKQGDILSWLKKDVNSLNPTARRVLATKLEMLLAKKNSGASKAPSSESSNSNTRSAPAQDSSSPYSLPGILDFDAEGLLSDKSFDGDDSLSLHPEPKRTVTRRSTFKVVQGKSVESAAAASGTTNNSATFVRPKKTEKAPGNSAKDLPVANDEQKQAQDPQRMQLQASSPAMAMGGGDGGDAGKARDVSPGTKAALDAIHHLEANPDMHDIQLLASLQEEELRRCLQSLKDMSRRRRTSSGNQRESETSPAASQSSGSGICAPVVPAGPAKTADRFSTYTKSKLMAGGVSANKNAAVAARKISHGPPPTHMVQGQVPLEAAQRVSSGLQKSLPNLSGSKSEFNLPAPTFPATTASEKGSYGDIPSALIPPNRTQVTTSSASRLGGTGSRLPTPGGRSRLPTPARSGIPMPRNPSLTPVSSGHRNKCPPTRGSAMSKTPSSKDNWNEGCF